MALTLTRHDPTERNYGGHCLAFSHESPDLVVGVLLVDAAAAHAARRPVPPQYASTGYMLDLEAWRGERLHALPEVHKERWFPTLDRALDCLAFFCWAVEGCSGAWLRDLCAEHDGRWT